MKCDYGCDQEANYHFKNGKHCCRETYKSCPAIIQRFTISLRTMKKEISDYFLQMKLIQTDFKIYLKKPRGLSQAKSNLGIQIFLVMEE